MTQPELPNSRVYWKSTPGTMGASYPQVQTLHLTREINAVRVELAGGEDRVELSWLQHAINDFAAGHGRTAEVYIKTVKGEMINKKYLYIVATKDDWNRGP
jgi:hypothetical protein